MDIVDAQIHMGPGGIDEVLSAMDALGIAGAVIDEYWLQDFTHQPHDKLADDAYRPLSPTAQLASMLHPDRFSFLLRLNRRDPELASIVRQVRDAPSGRALRIDPGLSPDEQREFAQGGYDHVFAAAADAGLPVFAFAPDNPEGFERIANAYPDCRIVIDHCGVYANSMRTGFAQREPLDDAGQLAMFDRVLALASMPNLHLKWGHASAMFDRPSWPGDALSPILRNAIDAFGAGRVMWASDYSVNQRGESWAELLFGVRSDPGLSETEQAAVLGGTVRTLLDWPATA